MENPIKKIMEHAQCVCTRADGLFMPSRHASVAVAFVLLVFFMSFMGGYFLGKKHVIDEFVAKVEQDSFADQIYTSLCLLSDQDPELMRASHDEAAEEVESAHESSAVQDAVVLSHAEPASSLESGLLSAQAEATRATGSDDLSDHREPGDKAYYAQLIGFGAEQTAQKYAQRLNKKNIPVSVRERESVSGKGKKRTWYQVVTRAFGERSRLEELVDRIAKEEKIKGIQIVACT